MFLFADNKFATRDDPDLDVLVPKNKIFCLYHSLIDLAIFKS